MRFGACSSRSQAAALRDAGWDYVEENVQSFLRGVEDDAQWNGAALSEQSPLPTEAAACLLPGAMKVVGPDVDGDALQRYMETVLRRAAQVGIEIIVFGSGKARDVPDGFSREAARNQIIEFLQMSAPLAAQNGVTLVIEPLNQSECNIINSVGEAMEYVEAAAHPHVRCLADSFHFWREADSLDSLRRAAPFLAHVHVADAGTRTPPGDTPIGESGGDYRAFFRVLKEGGYDARISVEATGFQPQNSARVLAFLKEQWNSV